MYMAKKYHGPKNNKKVIYTRDDTVESVPINTQTNPAPTPVRVVAPSENDRQLKKLNNLINNSHRILYEAASVFPFDFFPDRIVIDENKINIIHGVFFYSNKIFTILLEDVKNTFLTYNP